MHHRSLIASLLCAVVACGAPPPPQTVAAPPPPVVAVIEPAQPPVPGEPETPLDPAIRTGKLKNGMTFYVMGHQKPEQRAALWLAVNAGSVQEDDDQRGLAHFVEHMAFNGTKNFPKAEIINYLEKIGMGFGADLNASTDFDETIYKLTVPTDNKEFVGKGLDILRDWAGNISFDQAEVDKERGVVMEEWRLGRGAAMRVFDKQAKVLLKGSRYGDRLPIGLPDILKGAPKDALVRYYKDWYRPDLMAVVAVGDVDPAAMEKEIQARFGDLKNPDKPRPRPDAGVPKSDGTRVSIVTDKELPMAFITVNNLFPHRGEASVKDFRRIVAEQIYGQIVNERLGALGRRKEAAFSFAAVGVQPMGREIDMFSRIAQVKGGKAEDTLRALFTETLRVERHGFTPSELERARAVIKRNVEANADEEATSDSGDYVAEITRNFFEKEFMIGRKAERDYTLKFLPAITVEELNALAKSFGGSDNRVIMISGPEGQPLPTDKRMLEIVDEVSKSTIDPWQEKAVATALMAQPPKAGTITKETKIDSIGVTEWTLSNGARVILKPTNFEAEQVSISGDSPGGLALADAKTFPHARFADDLASIGGVGDLDDDALEKVLAGKRITAAASIGETTESVDGSASTRDLETLFQLMHLRFTAPRKDEEAFAVWKSNMTEQLATRLRVPEVKYALESQDVLYKKNVRRKAPESADIQKVDLDKALAFYKGRFGDATDFTFVIVGAFDQAKMKALVETYLASLPAKGRKEKEKDPGVRRAGGVIKKSWALGSEPKARVAVTFHGDEKWSRDKDRDMFILGQVLSMRLREILREDMGGVYGVGAGGYLSRRPREERTFGIQFGCAPDMVDKLIKASLDEVAVFAKQGIGADYLEKTKAQFLRDRETQLKTNGFWVGWLASSYRFGDDPTLVLDPSKMLARMTSDNVKTAAKKYLDGKQYYQAVLMPAPGTAAPAAPAPAPKK